ncbi:MAG TPA: geranylgeranylglycerol-phosphate geranylgeranyltransferase [Nitrososphaerales archaeon]|nr:geranylgeranylglycerol-phosphate geranylgeranyltransferase [Nitrososphaerales archaeon]
MKSEVKRKSFSSSLLSLIRPANSVLVGFAVVVGIAVTSKNYHEIFTLTSLLGFFTGFFVSSFSMVSNDIYDLEVDRVNQPGRPIPSGIVTVEQAKVFSVILLVLGLAASAGLGYATFGIATVFALIGWYYNYGGKKSGLFGNSLVALSLAIPYIFGSVALGSYMINLSYLLAVTSFLAGMGREVLKGVADMQGDKVRNVRTVAVSYGTKTAKDLSALFFLLAVVSSTLPLLLGLLGKAVLLYSGLILIPDAVFIFLAYKVLSLRNEQDSLRLKSTALQGMMLGLIVYLISGLLA